MWICRPSGSGHSSFFFLFLQMNYSLLSLFTLLQLLLCWARRPKRQNEILRCLNFFLFFLFIQLLFFFLHFLDTTYTEISMYSLVMDIPSSAAPWYSKKMCLMLCCYFFLLLHRTPHSTEEWEWRTRKNIANKRIENASQQLEDFVINEDDGKKFGEVSSSSVSDCVTCVVRQCSYIEEENIQ